LIQGGTENEINSHIYPYSGNGNVVFQRILYRGTKRTVWKKLAYGRTNLHGVIYVQHYLGIDRISKITPLAVKQQPETTT